MLTVRKRSAIITAGRDDALWMASPLCERLPPTSSRWMAAYFFFFLFFVSRPKRIAFSTKVGNLWFPSFRKAKTADGSNQRFEAQRREATIMTTETISKSDMISPPSTFVFRGEKPSAICFLPAGSPRASTSLKHGRLYASNTALQQCPPHLCDGHCEFVRSYSFSTSRFLTR